MKVIGITGGIGSGKSSVSKALCEKYSLNLIDADKISKKASDSLNVKKRIEEAFGSSVFNQDYSLNRAALAKVVFENENERRKLNDIIHPEVRKEFFNKLSEASSRGEELVIYDCPLLIEENLTADVDKTLLIYCEKEERIKRIVERDSLTVEQIKKRFASQMELEDKIPLCDIVFYNNGTKEDMLGALPELYRMILE